MARNFHKCNVFKSGKDWHAWDVGCGTVFKNRKWRIVVWMAIIHFEQEGK